MNPTETAKQVLADPAAQYQALIRSLRRRKGFGILFVQATPARGTRLIDEVRADLPQKNVAVLTLEEPITNLFKLIQARPDQDTLDILFIRGIEKSFDDYIKPGYGGEGNYYKLDTIPPILSHLNQQRDQFRDTFKFCLVFLVPRYALKYFIQRAPDFFDWRSGIVELVLRPEELQRETINSFLYGEFGNFKSLSSEERTKRILIIQDLIREKNQATAEKANLFYQLGLLLHSDNRYEEAIAAYDATLSIQSNYDDALHNKGCALSKLGQFEQAVSVYDAVLAIQPKYYDALYNKGKTLEKLGQLEQAIATYDAALAIKPDLHEALNNKGRALDELGQYEAAISAYDAALAIKPDSANAFYNRACCYGLQSKLDLAIADLKSAIELDAKYRQMAKTDTDFDEIRDDERFQQLLSES